MVTKELLHELFEYKDGELYWKIARSGIKINQKAGSLKPNAYVLIKINRKIYGAHRLIFLMHYGYLPINVDHIDCNPSNNKIENLREATRNQNNYNVKKRKDNTSGIKNVVWKKSNKKWVVQIMVNNKNKHIGCFDNLEFAELVAIEARNKYHGNFANHG